MEKSKVITLAANVAKLTGIRMTRPDLIRKQMSGAFPTATILSTPDYTLWIDAHYIAVDWVGLPGVIYIYISRCHIEEELRDVIKLRECSENLTDYRLYDSIAKHLMSAQKHINESGTDDFVLANYSEKIQGGHTNMKMKEMRKKRSQILTLTLCHKCKADFETGVYIVVTKGWQEHQEPCDYCTVGKGVTYGVFRKGARI